MKGSKDIERTTLGLQTDRPNDRTTDAKQNAPFFKGGIKSVKFTEKKCKFYRFFLKSEMFIWPLYASVGYKPTQEEYYFTS